MIIAPHVNALCKGAVCCCNSFSNLIHRQAVNHNKETMSVSLGDDVECLTAQHKPAGLQEALREYECTPYALSSNDLYTSS